MILPDVNLLVYTFNASAPNHVKSARWWEDVVNSGTVAGVCWPVFQGFVRLLTNRQIVTEPYRAGELFTIAGAWWSRPNVRLLAPTSETYRIFRELMEVHDLSGAASTDALIAAHAIEHDAVLATNDTDFLRFPGLRVENPLK